MDQEKTDAVQPAAHDADPSVTPSGPTDPLYFDPSFGSLMNRGCLLMLRPSSPRGSFVSSGPGDCRYWAARIHGDLMTPSARW